MHKPGAAVGSSEKGPQNWGEPKTLRAGGIEGRKARSDKGFAGWPGMDEAHTQDRAGGG